MYGIADLGSIGNTRAPTVIPAATEGTEPVRMKPVKPPPAVRRARMKAWVEGSLACMDWMR